MSRGIARRLAAAAAAGAAALAFATPAVAAPAHGAAPPGGYVVRAVPGALPSVLSDVTRLGGRVVRQIAIIDGATVRLTPAAAAALRGEPGVAAVTPDGSVQLLDARSAPVAAGYDPSTDPYSLAALESSIGVRNVWTRTTGAGVDVALIDSGVAPVAGLDAPGKVVHGPDLSFESQDPATRYVDTFGHGTHMAGIIAGHDAGVDATTAANDTSHFLGVAPDARLVSVKVADASGATDVSQVIAAIDWVVQHAHDNGLNIRVLNLSFGTNSAQSYLLDPLAYAAEQAWRHGIVVVASAGNSGGTYGRLADPAMDPFVIAVGADDTHGTPAASDDTVSQFSSLGDGLRNPDVLAPGAHVQSLRAPGSTADKEHSDTGRIDDRFFRGSGTSQAAAVISGVAALILQAHPDYTPDQVKVALVLSGLHLPNVKFKGQGFGVVQVPAALNRWVPRLAQPWPQSTGTGSLQAARGDSRLTVGGVTLSGEQDIFGRPFDAAAMAAAEADSHSWDGGDWNGSTWAGSTWAGSTWAGSTWAGSTWAGSTWAGSTWAGSTWADCGWLGHTWT